jgi:hypothetical protein
MTVLKICHFEKTGFCYIGYIRDIGDFSHHRYKKWAKWRSYPQKLTCDVTAIGEGMRSLSLSTSTSLLECHDVTDVTRNSRARVKNYKL